MATHRLPSPVGGCQNIDDWSECTWGQEALSSSATNVAVTFQPEDFPLYPYNPLDYNFEGWSRLGGLKPALSSPSSSFGLDLESSISNNSTRSLEDSFSNIGIDRSVTCCDVYSELNTACGLSPLCPENSPQENNQPSGGNGVFNSAEIQKLYDISMSSLSSCSTTLSHASSSNSELEEESQPPRRANKRQRPASSKNPKGSKVKQLSDPKKAHNVIERRYRGNLNKKIIALRDSLPGLCEDKDSAESDDDGQRESKKPIKKALIFTRAIEYIAQLEEENASLAKRFALVQSRSTALEASILGRNSQNRSIRP